MLSNLYMFNYYFLTFSFIFILCYLFYLPRVHPFMFIDIFEDRIIYLNKKVMFKDIENPIPSHQGHFKFRIKGQTNLVSLIFYKNAYALFADETIRKYKMVKE